MMITNRNVNGTKIGNQRDQLRCCVSSKTGLNSLRNWPELLLDQLRDRLIQIGGTVSAGR
jgi:hypothetical protein